MNYRIVPIALLVAFAVSGCIHTGSKKLDDVGNYLSLRPGISTKHDVYETFGQPSDVTYQGVPRKAPSRWTYYSVDSRPSGWTYIPYVSLVAGGVREHTTTAQFDFNAANRFLRLHTEKDSSYTNTWVGLTRGIYRIYTDPKQARVEQEMALIGRPYDKKAAKSLAERR